MIRKFVDRNEKGAVIVFLAITLPLLLVLVGGAIDFGNAYIHKSRLQNTADAAALAGARVYAINGEQALDESGHPKANDEARSYVEKNASGINATLSNVITNINDPKAFRAKPNASGSVVYYRVLLKETVPFYFLRIIGLNTVDISAEAIAAISASSGSGKNLFIFRNNFDAVNSIDNPDNFDMQGQLSNCVTFDGDIAFTNGDGLNPDNEVDGRFTLYHSTQNSNLKYFFTTKAKDEGLSVNQAVEKGPDYAFQETFVDYDMEQIQTAAKKAMNLQDYSNRNWENWDSYKTNFKFPGDFDNKTISSSDITGNIAVTANMANGDGNVNLTIDSSVGSSTEPLYVYFDESIYMVNFNVNASNDRPIIVCYTGNGMFHINLNNGSTFSGVIYAPHVSSNEGCLVNNSGNSKLKGSIIANYISLRGGGSYEYYDWGVGTGNNKNGSGQVTATSSVKLSEPDDITWS